MIQSLLEKESRKTKRGEERLLTGWLRATSLSGRLKDARSLVN